MERLKVNVLRGQDQIGENLIEISGGGTTVLLECGVPLFETEETAITNERAQTFPYDAVLISHAHSDHAGQLKNPVAAKRIYMGSGTLSVLKATGQLSEENEKKTTVFSASKSFHVGDLTVTPYLCDHSVFDSYMICVERGNERVLYTGDFRSTGRKDFGALLRRLPKSVDCLISENTNKNRIVQNATESDVENVAVSLMKRYRHVFVLQSATNVDRTVSFYKASVKSRRPFLMENTFAKLYARLKNIPDASYKNGYVYLAKGMSDEKSYAETKTAFGGKLLSKKEIVSLSAFTMQIKANAKNYLLKLKEEGFDFRRSVFVYSTWNGYKQTFAKEILETFMSLGVPTVDCHVSGHAGKDAVEKIINAVSPKKIIYVHQEKK